MHGTTAYLVSILFILAWGAFGVWTVRRLLLVPQSDPSLRFGVRVFGLLLWAASTIVWTVGDPHPRNIVLRVVENAFLILPMSLWAGYFAGRRIRRFVGPGGGDRGAAV